jgi:cold-inducible RNA-binding protein
MTTKLHVGNLAYTTTSEQIQAAFAQGGRQVTSVTMGTSKRDGSPRGFAFVQMGSEADAQAAIAALHETEIDSRTVKVSEAGGRFRPGR